MADKPKKLSYQPINLPEYKPINYNATATSMLPTLQQYAAANIGAQGDAQRALTTGAANLTAQLAPQLAGLRSDVSAAYSPQNVENYLGMIDQADPSFNAVRSKLGAQVLEGLNAGYDLGPEFSRQVEQDVRKGQTARGNWLGPAATADEAFAKASARLDLYNQRQGQATNYLNSRSTSDLFSQYAPLEGYQNVNVITPTGTYVDASLPAQVATAEAQNRSNYNNALLGAYSANTAAQTAVYDRNWSRYLYGQAGSYAPNTAASGNPWMGMMGGAATGALSGAVAGSAFGPWGTAIGAGAGAIIGGVGGAAGE